MSSGQTSIPCSIIRGGTSRGIYFLGGNLPDEVEKRDAVLLSVVGGPDSLQIDGVGGCHPLSNKVAIVGRSNRDDADVDYLFLQVWPNERTVSGAQNCGNILAGIGPFAIREGLVETADPTTVVRVHMVNSGNRCDLLVPTPAGSVQFEGTTSIDGVPGTAAAIVCNYLNTAGSMSGALLPTGSVLDRIDGIAVTCIDNGMPVVLLRASDFGLEGNEAPESLDENSALKTRLESLRLKLGLTMNLGDVADKTVPKMCLVSPAAAGGVIATRTFIPHVCHRSIGVLGALSVATACLLPGSVADGLASVPEGSEKDMQIEHPSGAMSLRLTVDPSATTEQRIQRAGVIRTARTLMRGEIYVPRSIWHP